MAWRAELWPVGRLLHTPGIVCSKNVCAVTRCIKVLKLGEMFQKKQVVSTVFLYIVASGLVCIGVC